jgi:aminoglycoside phosphotransferase (APT) family kinase protein
MNRSRAGKDYSDSTVLSMPFSTLTRDFACEVLAAAGFRFAPDQIRVEARDERWLVRLPESLVAWFAASEDGSRRMATERRVLRLLQQRCTFLAPRILTQHREDDFDVRTMVPGIGDPLLLFAQMRADVELAQSIGADVGAILAEQHKRIEASDVAGWLPRQPSWPEPGGWIPERLDRVINDPELVADAEAVIEKCESMSIPESDRAMVHTDVGIHNLGIDPESRKVLGIFDYGDGAWADRHHDFRYLLFDLDRLELLDAAISAYEAALGRSIQTERVILYNAACAITFLAYRAGTAPEERSCGRTLVEDLRWSKQAIARALAC